MTMMDFALLERRREINRKAARKSRSRQKEFANQIRKKYYEAQSTNTKLVYERKRLVRERDELSTTLRDHRRSCPNCTIQSSEECLVDLPDEDLQPRAGIQIQTRRSTYHKIPSSVLGASPPLSRSISCPESSAANLSQLQWIEEDEDNIVLSSTSDEDEDDDDDEEEEEEEEEKDDEPPNAVLSPDYFSFTDLGIAETSGNAIRDASSDMALIADESLISVFNFEDQTDFLGEIEADEDPFSLLDDLSPSASMQTFGRSVDATDPPLTSSKPSSAAAGVEKLTRITGFDSSQTFSTATTRHLVDATGTFCDDQQSEAIDLSKPRATLATDQSSVRAATSVNAKLNEQKVSEPSTMRANVGNIPLHVHNFIVGEK